MRRLDQNELKLVLRCPDCGGNLTNASDVLVCNICQMNFPFFRNHPVLLSRNNELFPLSVYQSKEVTAANKAKRYSIGSLMNRLTPSKSVNIIRERMFHQLANEYRSSGQIVLVVGCGNQAAQIERCFHQCDTVFVFCDVDKHADADLFCDSHNLPFHDEFFDGILTTAVLEHVLYPDRVVSEMYRVLKASGFVYSEIPFLQSVHQGAYDFTRFTISGHRRLFECFHEVESGIVAGPGTALVWSIDDFMKSLVPNRKISKLLQFCSRVLFGGLKYCDYLMKNNPHALNSSSCTYFYGNKATRRISAVEIINAYRGNEYKHL